MIKEELLGKLKSFNLNSYESKIWVALLTQGLSTAGSLSEIANVPRSRCYDVLESLEKKGFIVMKVGKPIKYIAVSPVEVIDRLKQKTFSEAEEKVKILENTKTSSMMEELTNLYSSGKDTVKSEELIGLVKSDKNIRNHLSSIMKNSNKILLSTDSKSLKHKSQIIKEILDNDGEKDVKIITSHDADEKLVNEVSKFAEIKKHDEVNKFCVTDEHAVMFLTNNNDSDDSLVWLNSDYSVNTLQDLFHHKWNNI